MVYPGCWLGFSCLGFLWAKTSARAGVVQTDRNVGVSAPVMRGTWAEPRVRPSRTFPTGAAIRATATIRGRWGRVWRSEGQTTWKRFTFCIETETSLPSPKDKWITFFRIRSISVVFVTFHLYLDPCVRCSGNDDWKDGFPAFEGAAVGLSDLEHGLQVRGGTASPSALLSRQWSSFVLKQAVKVVVYHMELFDLRKWFGLKRLRLEVNNLEWGLNKKTEDYATSVWKCYPWYL